MDMLFYVTAAVLAVGILLLVAEPERIFPHAKDKKELVGSSYWGLYEGTSAEPDTEKKIEVIRSRRKEKYIAGSTTYAKGRGVNMSGKS